MDLAPADSPDATVERPGDVREPAIAAEEAAAAQALAASPMPQRLQVMGRSTAAHGGFPLSVLVLLVLFLLLQDRIDRRDPKLALAPEHAEPDLRFSETPIHPPDATELPR
jgi:hypothetical protein